jgi:hypothetical protein
MLFLFAKNTMTLYFHQGKTGHRVQRRKALIERTGHQDIWMVIGDLRVQQKGLGQFPICSVPL